MDKLERRIARLWRRLGGGRRRERRSKKDESSSSLPCDDVVVLNNKTAKTKNVSPSTRHRHQSDSTPSRDSRSKDLSRALVRLYAYARLRSLQNLIIAESTPASNSSTTTDLDNLELGRPMDQFSFLSSLPQLSIPRLKNQDIDKLCLSRESGYLTNSPWEFSSSSETLRQQRSPSLARPNGHLYKKRSTPRKRLHASHGDVWATSNIHRPRDALLFETMESFLSRNVYKSKCVTCVFEAAHAGLGVLLDDILAEFNRWFVGRKMLIVASELHFSVPLARRCRKQELVLKQQMLRSLLENNRRILYLQGSREALPIRMAEARTEENIFNDNELQAVQGVYQRCYHRLLPFVHSETPDWHAPYWKLTPAPVRPRTSVLLLDNDYTKLRTHSLVSFNIIGLSIYAPLVKLVVSAWNVFDPSKNASRVLRVAVEDVDDVPPEFPKGSTTLFTVPRPSKPTDLAVGRVSAAKGNSDALHYYLLPKCTQEFDRFSVSERSGEVSLTNAGGSNLPNRMELCVLASTHGGLNVDDVVFDAKNASILRAVVAFETERPSSPQLPMVQNNSVTILRDNMRSASIPVATAEGPERSVRYSLDHVQFTPTQNGIGVPNSATSALFFVDPISGDVSANPQLSEQPQGVYSVVVNAVDTKSAEPLQRIVKKFHYVKDDMKLRYVFSMGLEEFATGREQFSKKLQEALKADHPEGQMQVFFSEPERDIRNATRTSVCFHVVMNERVQNERSAIFGAIVFSPRVENSGQLEGLHSTCVNSSV
ncbi:hypothetical protein OSTOST_11219 [Ostertagia ostertagi]